MLLLLLLVAGVMGGALDDEFSSRLRLEGGEAVLVASFRGPAWLSYDAVAVAHADDESLSVFLLTERGAAQMLGDAGAPGADEIVAEGSRAGFTRAELRDVHLSSGALYHLALVNTGAHRADVTIRVQFSHMRRGGPHETWLVVAVALLASGALTVAALRGRAQPGRIAH